MRSLEMRCLADLRRSSREPLIARLNLKTPDFAAREAGSIAGDFSAVTSADFRRVFALRGRSKQGGAFEAHKSPLGNGPSQETLAPQSLRIQSGLEFSQDCSGHRGRSGPGIFILSAIAYHRRLRVRRETVRCARSLRVR